MQTSKTMETKIKTPTIYDIKYATQEKEPHFFDRQTLKFFGDTMKNFGVFQEDGEIFIYRKKPVKHGLTGTWLYNWKEGTLNKVMGS